MLLSGWFMCFKACTSSPVVQYQIMCDLLSLCVGRSLLGMIEENLLKIGLEVHHQHFSARLPLTGGGVQGRGVNMYATLRAQRASGMEALVVHVPLTDHSTLEPAFVLVLAKFFARKLYYCYHLFRRVWLATSRATLCCQ